MNLCTRYPWKIAELLHHKIWYQQFQFFNGYRSLCPSLSLIDQAEKPHLRLGFCLEIKPIKIYLKMAFE